MSQEFKNNNFYIKNLKFGVFVLALLSSVNAFLNAQSNQIAAPTISIENPIEVNTAEFVLSWDSLDETNFYNFQLCTDTACEVKIKEISKAGQASVALNNIDSGQYYWRVSGVDENNQNGEYSTPQPLLVELITTEAQKELFKETVQETVDLKKIILKLPWYIYLIILAYLIFIARTLIWYLNK